MPLDAQLRTQAAEDGNRRRSTRAPGDWLQDPLSGGGPPVQLKGKDEVPADEDPDDIDDFDDWDDVWDEEYDGDDLDDGGGDATSSPLSFAPSANNNANPQAQQGPGLEWLQPASAPPAPFNVKAHVPNQLPGLQFTYEAEKQPNKAPPTKYDQVDHDLAVLLNDSALGYKLDREADTMSTLPRLAHHVEKKWDKGKNMLKSAGNAVKDFFTGKVDVGAPGKGIFGEALDLVKEHGPGAAESGAKFVANQVIDLVPLAGPIKQMGAGVLNADLAHDNSQQRNKLRKENGFTHNLPARVLESILAGQQHRLTEKSAMQGGFGALNLAAQVGELAGAPGVGMAVAPVEIITDQVLSQRRKRQGRHARKRRRTFENRLDIIRKDPKLQDKLHEYLSTEQDDAAFDEKVEKYKKTMSPEDAKKRAEEERRVHAQLRAYYIDNNKEAKKAHASLNDEGMRGFWTN